MELAITPYVYSCRATGDYDQGIVEPSERGMRRADLCHRVCWMLGAVPNLAMNLFFVFSLLIWSSKNKESDKDSREKRAVAGRRVLYRHKHACLHWLTMVAELALSTRACYCRFCFFVFIYFNFFFFFFFFSEWRQIKREETRQLSNINQTRGKHIQSSSRSIIRSRWPQKPQLNPSLVMGL